MIEFFSPVSKSVIAHKETLPLGALGKEMEVYAKFGSLPDVTGVKFALFGVKEDRNTINYMSGEISFSEIRKAIYSLYPGNWSHKIVDLGNIEEGKSIEDTYFAFKAVCEALLKIKVIPIILGGGQDLVYAHYRSYDVLGKMINMVNVDQRFDLGDADMPITNKSYVGKIIVDEPYNLFNYSVLGYQSYFNPPDEIALMEKLFFDAYRLGEVVTDITLVEPIMRNADVVVMDASAIKSAELSYKYSSSPNGFDSREICAIARYAGISNKVTSFGFYELKNFNQIKSASALIAQIVWYFIEGVNFRVKDDDFTDKKSYTTYKVPIGGEVLTFKKSSKTGRWWIELPFISPIDNKLKGHTLLPCTYGEYLSATQQEVPERWLKARQKNEV